MSDAKDSSSSHDRTSMTLPPVRKTPCSECPWVRGAAPGWLGPLSAEGWEHLVHGEEPIACHVTIPEENKAGDWSAESILQCAGAAIYRSNICKSPRNPDVATLPANRDLVFEFGEFVEYHDKITQEEHLARHQKDPII